MKSKRWICIQGKSGYAKQDWFAEWTLAYTRKESIKACIGDSGLSWDEVKANYNWRCSKVELTITEI